MAEFGPATKPFDETTLISALKTQYPKWSFLTMGRLVPGHRLYAEYSCGAKQSLCPEPWPRTYYDTDPNADAHTNAYPHYP